MKTIDKYSKNKRKALPYLIMNSRCEEIKSSVDNNKRLHMDLISNEVNLDQENGNGDEQALSHPNLT